MKTFFLDLARKILRKSTVDNNSADQLCQIKLEHGQTHYDTGSICLLKLEEMKFGQTFLSGKFNFDYMISTNHWLVDIIFVQLFLGIIKFSKNTQNHLKDTARNFLVRLFIGLQKRMLDTFKLIQIIEPFSLPKFKTTAPKLSDYIHPFFKTDTFTRCKLERYVYA